MTDLQRSILAISSALVILLAALILRSTGNQAEKIRVAETELLFDSSSAHDKAQALATGFPERATGTDGARAAAQWIESEMTKLGLRTGRQKFSAWIAGERVEGQNVIGIDEGIRDGAIVMIAHYDIPFHVREGAMDDASGVGTLLELARAFSHEEQKKTLVFIASDGEEWGMLGARHFVKEYSNLELIPAKYRNLKSVRAAISLDCMPLENPRELYIQGQGQFRGYVPLWLWMLAEDCISEVGGKPNSIGPLMQYVSQAVNISSTDQGPFLRLGVPGVNLGAGGSNSPLAHKVYHTTLDTSENLRPELFDTYGKAAELMVRSIGALDYSTDNNPHYLRTGKRSYVGRSGLQALQIFLFLPLLLATSFQYYNLRTRESFLRDALAEMANIGLFMLPWVFALVTLYLLVWRNLIPRYELYPATPLDPFLREPHWKAIATVAVIFAATWAAVLLVRRSVAFLRRPAFASSKAACLDTLLTLSIIALLLNGFAASLFLAPAALLWGWIEQDRRPVWLALNAVWVVVAAIPFVLLIVMTSSRLALGPYVSWYLLLGAGYGLFSPLTLLVAAGVATVGGRLLQKSFYQDNIDSLIAEPETDTE